jgi:hypothetical protein
MQPTMTPGGNRAAMLAALDDARDRFLAVFDAVPDAALGYRPPGDDFALGALAAHLDEGLASYTELLARLRATEADELDFRLPELVAAFERRRDEIHVLHPSGEDRATFRADLLDSHARFCEALASFPVERFTHVVGVHFPGGDEPYATTPGDVAVWMTTHYEEHADQAADLLARWAQGEGRER